LTTANSHSADSDVDEADEDEELDEEDLSDLAEADLAREASDEQEIEDLEVTIWLTEKDTALGKSALTKVSMPSLSFIYIFVS
jgi:predicted DNA binding CopG/RHH family protein